MNTGSARHRGDGLENSEGRPSEASMPDGHDYSMLQTYWNAFDALDADRVALHFAPCASFRLCHEPPLCGRPAIRRAFVHLFTEAEFIHHHPVAIWSRNGLTVADADVRVVLENGHSVMVPITTTLWQRRNEILACQIHLPPVPALIHAIRGFTTNDS